jgi:hypothetical protein
MGASGNAGKHIQWDGVVDDAREERLRQIIGVAYPLVKQEAGS